MLIQSSATQDDRGLDAYFTPIEAIRSLMRLESLPGYIWEPACGDGAIVKPLRAAGHEVHATDLADYGLEDSWSKCDYLTQTAPRGIQGIVTNPPFKHAQEFISKAVGECGFVAMLLRTNFLESMARYQWFKNSPPDRVWISSRRLPMMHRYGWTGKQAGSNTCHAWFVWDAKSDRTAGKKCALNWFDWKEHVV